MHADAIETGDPATPAECVTECSMASNVILSYGGVSPASAVVGTKPRDLVEFDVGAMTPQSSDDYLERSIRFRLIAKSCIMKALVEQRFLQANKTRPQQVDESKLIPGSAVEIWRAPETKAGAGWHGLARLLEIDKDIGGAIVVWQGRPFKVPLRHVREHVGYIMAWLMISAANRKTIN